MCTCASCIHTDSFSGKGFAEWPRGKPAGKSAARDYAAHVRYSQQWGRAPNGNMYGKPECSKRAPNGPVHREDPHARYKFPSYAEDMTTAAYVAAFERDNNFSTAELVAARAAEEERRRVEQVRYLAKYGIKAAAPYQVQSSANDTEERDMRYMTVAQASEAWGISHSRIRQWLADGRIKGAHKVGRDWLIPAGAVRPVAARPGELQAAAR